MKKSLLLLILVVILIAGAMGLTASLPAFAQDGGGNPTFFPIAMNAAWGKGPSDARIFAFAPDGYALRDVDEAFAIQNVGETALLLGGWQVTDGEGVVILPDITVPRHRFIWCARHADAFEATWGMKPGCEYGGDADPDVPDATGTILNLNNEGDELQLISPSGQVVDAVVFGDEGDVSIDGWSGEALQPYTPSNAFAREGQVFYRLFDKETWLPVSDTDARSEWAQGNDDPIHGRRTAYPGWDLIAFSRPIHITYSQPRSAQLLVTPDNALTPIIEAIDSAELYIYVETYELTHPMIVDALARKARAGREVRVLLEGSPAGGLTDDSRWAAQQLVEAGARVDFMVNDVDNAHDRYPFIHAKFIVIDGHILILSTENFKLSSMPADTDDGETLGRRGYAVIIDDWTLPDRAMAILAADDNRDHADIFPWQADHPQYGLPHDPNYQPPQPQDLMGYRVRYSQPFPIDDVSEAIEFTAPETSLIPLLSLIEQAGPGDVILTQQLFEHPYWGPTDSNPADDPNVRLEALIEAARRGASVRILLDSFFDDPHNTRSNLNTVNYVNDIAANEGVDIQARLGNPAGAGLHAKLHLLAIGDKRWVVLASMNGGEASNKLNREISLALETGQGYNALARVFLDDWNSPTLQQAPSTP